MLSFGLSLGSLGYKQQVLASGSTASQYAFYAADAALECALHADQKLDSFAYPPSDPSDIPEIICDNITPFSQTKSWSSSLWIVTNRLSLDSGDRCADVTVYKYTTPQPPNNATSYLFSQGYDVPCSVIDIENARFVSRGISIYY